jgi:hypothetical protein
MVAFYPQYPDRQPVVTVGLREGAGAGERPGALNAGGHQRPWITVASESKTWQSSGVIAADR